MKDSFRRKRTLLFRGNFETESLSQAPLQKMSRIKVESQMVDEESQSYSSSSHSAKRPVISDKLFSDDESNTFLSSLSVTSAMVGSRIITRPQPSQSQFRAGLDISVEEISMTDETDKDSVSLDEESESMASRRISPKKKSSKGVFVGRGGEIRNQEPESMPLCPFSNKKEEVFQSVSKLKRTITRRFSEKLVQGLQEQSRAGRHDLPTFLLLKELVDHRYVEKGRATLLSRRLASEEKKKEDEPDEEGFGLAANGSVKSFAYSKKNPEFDKRKMVDMKKAYKFDEEYRKLVKLEVLKSNQNKDDRTLLRKLLERAPNKRKHGDINEIVFLLRNSQFFVSRRHTHSQLEMREFAKRFRFYHRAEFQHLLKYKDETPGYFFIVKGIVGVHMANPEIPSWLDRKQEQEALQKWKIQVLNPKLTKEHQGFKTKLQQQRRKTRHETQLKKAMERVQLLGAALGSTPEKKKEQPMNISQLLQAQQVTSMKLRLKKESNQEISEEEKRKIAVKDYFKIPSYYEPSKAEVDKLYRLQELDQMILLPEVDRLASGQSFGNSFQNAHVQITTLADCHFAFLRKKDYLKVRQRIEDVRQEARIQFFKEIPCFQQVNPKQILKIVRLFKQEHFVMNQVLAIQGKPASRVYLLFKGNLQISRRKKNSKTKDQVNESVLKVFSKARRDGSSIQELRGKVGLLKSSLPSSNFQVTSAGPGTMIGFEDAVINGNYMMTVICKSASAEVYSISKQDFVDKLSKYDRVWESLISSRSDFYLRMQSKMKQAVKTKRILYQSPPCLEDELAAKKPTNYPFSAPASPRASKAPRTHLPGELSSDEDLKSMSVASKSPPGQVESRNNDLLLGLASEINNSIQSSNFFSPRVEERKKPRTVHPSPIRPRQKQSFQVNPSGLLDSSIDTKPTGAISNAWANDGVEAELLKSINLPSQTPLGRNLAPSFQTFFHSRMQKRNPNRVSMLQHHSRDFPQGIKSALSPMKLAGRTIDRGLQPNPSYKADNIFLTHDPLQPVSPSRPVTQVEFYGKPQGPQLVSSFGSSEHEQSLPQSPVQIISPTSQKRPPPNIRARKLNQSVDMKGQLKKISQFLKKGRPLSRAPAITVASTMGSIQR